MYVECMKRASGPFFSMSPFNSYAERKYASIGTEMFALCIQNGSGRKFEYIYYARIHRALYMPVS